MNLIIEGNSHKINNFVDYLIENYAEEGKTYKFQLEIQDKYDRRLIEKRAKSLKDNLLIFMNDEFEIINSSVFNDYDKFIEDIGSLFSDEINEKIDKENYKNQFVKYEIEVIDDKEKLNFDFYYLDLNT